MPTPYIAPIPADTELTNGCTIEFVALDPATGNAQSGITVANISIYYDGLGGATLESPGPFMRVPGPGA